MLCQAEQVSLSVWSGIEDEKGLYVSKNARPGNADIVTRVEIKIADEWFTVTPSRMPSLLKSPIISRSNLISGVDGGLSENNRSVCQSGQRGCHDDDQKTPKHGCTSMRSGRRGWVSDAGGRDRCCRCRL